MSLVKMDLLTRYRKSVLGVFWSLLHPLGMTAVFTFVFYMLGVAGAWKDQAMLTLAGMAVFGFLRDCALQGCQSLIRHESYIRQAPLPFGIYSLRTMLTNLVHFLITLGVLVVFVAALKKDFTVFANLWMILPIIPLVMIMGWALSSIFGYATVYFHDISHLLELFAQFLFFMTPIIYRPANLIQPMKGLDGNAMRDEFGNVVMNDKSWIANINPATAFIDLFRKPLVEGEVPMLGSYTFAIVTTILTAMLAVWMDAKLSKRVIFQM